MYVYTIYYKHILVLWVIALSAMTYTH